MASSPPAVASPFSSGSAQHSSSSIFCAGFQPLQARKNADRAPTPFADQDFGHKELPIVFENSYYFVQRAFYGQGPGSYTKCMYSFFQSWYPRYHTASVALVADLPETFLAVDDDYTKTFEWVFAHHPELTKQLLGTHTATHNLHGEERI